MRAPGLRVATEEGDEDAVVRVAGELDLDGVEDVVGPVVAALHAGTPVTIDLTGVSFMDSSGIEGLARCRRAALEADRALVVEVRADGPVVRRLAWTGLDSVLDVRAVG